MAGPPKKRAPNDEEEESASSENESESGSYNGQEEIQADFEGRNPDVQDFHGIKQLLKQLFLKAHIDLSQLSDMLIAQTGVGSVLKQSGYDEDDDEDEEITDTLDVFGITSILNLSSHKETPCVKQLFELVSELSKEHAENSIQAEIENILSSSKKIGLLINERFLNIPAKISDPLLNCLIGEIDRLKKKDSSYDFDYYVMICKVHKAKDNKDNIAVFANAEEEIFVKEAQVSFEFDVLSESDSSVSGKWTEGDVEMIPHRKVIFFKGNKLNTIVQKVSQFVS